MLERLLRFNFHGANALLEQLAEVLVYTLDADGGLRLQPMNAVPVFIERRIPVEATYPDSDGVIVHVLIHVVNGLLNELEIFREDGATVVIPAANSTVLKVEPWIT